jgi:RES domain-containing protein
LTLFWPSRKSRMIWPENVLKSAIYPQTGENLQPLQSSPSWEMNLRNAESTALIVPSVLAPAENNWLINPEHPDYKRIEMHEVAPLNHDPRMFVKQTGHGRRKRFQQ